MIGIKLYANVMNIFLLSKMADKRVRKFFYHISREVK